MTLEETKEKLTAEREVALRTGRRDLYVALGIGSEAIDALIRSRLGDPPLDGELLPGETE